MFAGKTKQQLALSAAAGSRVGRGTAPVTLPAPSYHGAFPSAEDEVAYCRSILRQAAVQPGELAVINANCAEVFAAGPSFAIAAADLGAQVAIIDPSVQSLSNQQLSQQAAAMERVAAGQGVHIATLSMDGTAGQPLPLHPDQQRMLDTAPGLDPEADRREAEIERFNQALTTWNQGLAEQKTRWSETRWPTEQWAVTVFPDVAERDGPEEALRQLTALLQAATNANDPRSQAEQQEQLQRRAAALNDPLTGASRFREIIISSPPESDHPADIGTDLRIGIAEQSAFASASVPDGQGQITALNYPSEEVFTTPNRHQVSGYFTTTRPYITKDQDGAAVAITGIVGRFDPDGRMKLQAFDPADQHWLDRDFNDQGPAPTNVLSELGLVDCSGPLAASGRVFYDTMYDEGTGVHLGSGTSHAVYTGGNPQQIAPTSGPAHRDLVIGQQQTTVLGIDHQGAETELILHGLWQDQFK